MTTSRNLADQHAFPVAGQTLVSAPIIQSLFATRHWDVFHWPTPASEAIGDLGLVGYSYEAYQPPVFYLLMVPLYLAAPGSVLARLFVLRFVVVGLSLITVFFAFRTAQLITSSVHFAALSTLILVALPERTIAMSRLNNDVLVEVLGAAICYLATVALLHGLTRKNALVLGLLLALGVWTKLSMAFWIAPLAVAAFLARRQSGIRFAGYTGALYGLALIGLFVRNWIVYQDITGYGSLSCPLRNHSAGDESRRRCSLRCRSFSATSGLFGGKDRRQQATSSSNCSICASRS